MNNYIVWIMHTDKWGIKDLQTNKEYLLRLWAEVPAPLKERMALLNVAPSGEYVEGLGRRRGKSKYFIECEYDWEES
jgi:hypothetical protein